MPGGPDTAQREAGTAAARSSEWKFPVFARSKGVSKGDSIPTRFDPPEEEALAALKHRTGLPTAEIIRRAVRLLKKRYNEEKSAAFIIEDLAPDDYGRGKKVEKMPSPRRKVVYPKAKKRQSKAA
jgi:hypothetical protein